MKKKKLYFICVDCGEKTHESEIKGSMSSPSCIKCWDKNHK